jgi:outer membrane murein-binding lipoprotein Lpp
MQKTSMAFFAAMVICSLSLWGCTDQKSGAANNKIRELEIRHAKLEEDYRVILAVNESNRRKIQQLETTRTDLTHKIEELQIAVVERDELRNLLATRTDERDNLQGQLVQFSKDLQSLANRAQAAAVRSHGGSVLALPASRQSP